MEESVCNFQTTCELLPLQMEISVITKENNENKQKRVEVRENVENETRIVNIMKKYEIN